MTRCKLCQVRVKYWMGSDPKCAFNQKFEDNWNCATLTALRNIVDNCWNRNHQDGVNYEYFNDENYASILLTKIFNGDPPANLLWMQWYKSRGHTEEVLLLCTDKTSRHPTEEECLTIIKSYAESVDFSDEEEVRLVLSQITPDKY